LDAPAAELWRYTANNPRCEEDVAFSHGEVFPIIARIAASQNSADYMSHRDIAGALVRDPEARAILDREGGNVDQRASNMVAWFSQQFTVGRNPWAPFFERTRRGGAYAYRAVTVVPAPLGGDPEITAVEGEPRLVSHLRRERDRALSDAKKRATIEATRRLRCEACGFDARRVYPWLEIDFAEVHHNVPLSDAESPVETALTDLSVLCANCHRMIHRTKPMLSVAEFARLLRAKP
jgi:hypothetical protein